MKKRIIGALITIVVIATVVFIYKGEKFESTTLIAGKSENGLEAAILSEVDISENGDGSVMATLSSDQKTLTITGNGKMKDFDNKDNKAPWNKYLERITTVDIQEGVQNIGAYAFIWQTSCNLSNLNLPNSITEIGEEAFEQCTGITNLNLPNNLKKIDSYAFSRCRGIDTINLKNVEEIGDFAFFMCSNLETVEITDKTTTMGEAVFMECHNLKSITVDSENTNYCSVDGILFNKDKTELLRYPPQKLDSTTYSIPTTVTKIGATAFEDCSTITNIEIPNGVTEIEGWAFDRCSSLSSFTIPNGVTTIKTNTFSGCKSFTSFEIPSNVTKFEGNWIFHGCSNLNKLTVNSYFSGVGLDTFYGCDKLETLVITEEAESINSFIFESIDALKKIEIDNNNRCLKTDANGEILYNYEITKVIGCIQLKEGKIILPKTITEIEGGAFQSCSLITSLEIPLKVTSIGSSAFNGMGTVAIYLPKNVKLGSNNGSGNNKTIYCHSSASGFSALRVEDDDAPIVNIDKNNGFIINATDSESGLSSYNEYEYYISSSKTALTNGTWTKYNLGEKFNITENEGDTYVFVKPISDKIGNTYETDSVEIDGERYNLIYEKVIEEETAPVLTTDYSTKVLTNKDVIVTITADKQIQEVEGWTLSIDKKTLTKTYTSNGNETVTVYGLNGKSSKAAVSVSNIDKLAPTLTVTYSTTNLTNSNVVVTITSNEEIQGVEGWILSNNKKILTKTYTVNGNETVRIYDIAGNGSNATVNVANIDQTSIQAEVTYSTTKLTNEDVTVTITADKQIQEVEGWELSSDKKTLTKTYTSNGTEEVTVKDLAGNNKNISISVANIDKIPPELTAKYSTTEQTSKDVVATITANEEIQEVEGWELSSDKKILTKTYTSNGTEEVIVKDLVGNETKTNIKVSNIEIEKTTNTSKPANNTVDNTVANKILPKTGIVAMLSISFVVLIIISIVLYKKVKEYSDVK